MNKATVALGLILVAFVVLFAIYMENKAHQREGVYREDIPSQVSTAKVQRGVAEEGVQ